MPAGSRQFPSSSAPRWRRSASGFLLAVVSGCRFVGTDPLAPDLQARARVLRIEDTHRDEPALIESLLASTDAPTRAAAALAAGRIGGRSHVTALRRLGDDRDPRVAANALFSLGLLKDSASAALAVAALRAGPEQATEAARLLGELGDRSAIITALGDASLGRPTHAALLLAAARLKPVPASAVTPYLAGDDSALAWRAAYAIARGRSAAGARSLLAQRNSPWSSVREQVARGASRSLAGDSLGALALRALQQLAADASARVRTNAMGALASYGVAARSPVVSTLTDPDVNVRVSASQALTSVLDSTSVTWVRLFDAETSFVVRRNIADAASRHGVRLAVHAGWAASERWQERAAAAALDGAGPAAAAVPRLQGWLRDDDVRVRVAAAARYAGLVDSSAVRHLVRAGLRGMLADPSASVRASALNGLAIGGSPDDLAAAVASYRRLALLDVDNDARLAFWHLTDSVVARHVTTLPDSVQRSLATLARPSDPIERNLAAHIGRFASWRDSTGTARALAWYEARARELAAPAPTLRIETERGTMEFVLFASDAPLTVYNVTSLARDGYFDGQLFHRVVPNFVVQSGDPRGDGNGGPGYAIRDELNRHRYIRGTLGMALSGPDTGGSQFFVTHSPQPHLDGGYTVFGQLISGEDVLDRIVQGDRIVRVSVH